MSDQRQGFGLFEDNVRVIGVLPKSSMYEQRVTFKHVGSGRNLTPFVDIREYWFKNGPADEPIPTGKGVMVKEDQAAKLVEYLLLGIADGSIEPTQADKLVRLIEAKRSK